LESLRLKQLITSQEWIPSNVLSKLVAVWHKLNRYSDALRDFFRGALVLSIRSFATFSGTKNPNWIKPGGMSSSLSVKEIAAICTSCLINYYKRFYAEDVHGISGKCQFTAFDAEYMSLPNPVDTIIFSLPSRMRCDIIRLYAPELHFLSKVDGKDYVKVFSKNIIGSNMLRDYSSHKDLPIIADYSQRTIDLLKSFEKKAFKKENDYYMRYFAQYFGKLLRILRAIYLLLAHNGRMYIIIRNGFCCGELIPVDDFVSDCLRNMGLKVMVIDSTTFSQQGTYSTFKRFRRVLGKRNKFILRATT
jgi:hypothetical protein